MTAQQAHVQLSNRRKPKSLYRVGNCHEKKKMVTYFNRRDLVSFGTYLLSEKRKSRFEESFQESVRLGIENPLPVEDALAVVNHADVENWLADQRGDN